MRTLAAVATFAALAACKPNATDAELACIVDYLNRTGPGVTRLVNRVRQTPNDGEHIYNGLAAVMQRQRRLDLAACPADLRAAHAAAVDAYVPIDSTMRRLIAARTAPAPAERERLMVELRAFGEKVEAFGETLLRYRGYPTIEKELGPWVEDMRALARRR